ncbi:MAG: hypothetical protein ABS948_04475 [Solibacillus sp.]
MRRKAIGIGLILMVGWLVFIYFFGTPFPWKLLQAKQDSIAYLEERYDEPFTVGMPRFWIMDGTFHAKASPKAIPNLVFSVGTEQGKDGI